MLPGVTAELYRAVLTGFCAGLYCTDSIQVSVPGLYCADSIQVSVPGLYCADSIGSLFLKTVLFAAGILPELAYNKSVRTVREAGFGGLYCLYGDSRLV